MRIIVLCASGNKTGCTHGLGSAFSDHCRQIGHDAEVIDLHYYDIKDCTGCGSCSESGRCRIDDECGLIFTKIESADLVVFVTPVRFNGVSSILKRFIDRMNPYWHSGSLKVPYACAIVIGGSPTPVFTHALSEIKSGVAVMSSEWKGELLISGTDGGGCSEEDAETFAERILSSCGN